MAGHALLSPSAAHRWLHCTPAPRLEANVEDEGSSFAEEGSLAHAYCAKKLKTFLGQATDSEDKEIAELNEQYHTGEMDEYTDTYKTIVLERFNATRAVTPDALLLVETHLDFSDYVPNAFGTADAIIIADGVMDVIDFKYGKGVEVSAVDNPQMMIYALGAYLKFAFEYNIGAIRMTIIQPRIDNLSQATVSVTELIGWAEKVLKPKAQEAFEGKGKQQPGNWCRFCKVKCRCRALADTCQQIAEKANDPKLLTAEELGEKVLPLLPIVKTWLTGVEEYALAQALSGVKLPGWKIVEGRSVRKITNPSKVGDILEATGYDSSLVYKPTELRTITDLEKTVGKKLFAELCGAYIEKPKGKPTLAPLKDKRKAIDPIADDFDGINVE